MSLVDRHRFRANPRYELVRTDRLTSGERHLLGDLAEDEIYGVLRPSSESGLDARVCSPDTAFLFLTLAEPGTIPSFARKSLGDHGERILVRLVVDGVLEILTGDGFRSGPTVAGLLLPRRSDAGQGRIAELSAAALRYGQAMLGLPVDVLARRIYFYGRRPASPGLRRRMPDATAVDQFVGITPDGPAGEALEAGWVRGPDSVGSPWRYWASRSGRQGTREPGRVAATYKLYVSPAIDGVPTAVSAVAASLATSPGVTGFKVARDLPGLCRPDKIVVYFDRLDDLRRGASRMTERLEGVSAHGVPFTAAVTLDGLLSWGSDPPRGSAVRTSWRMWVAEHVAEYLVIASRADGGRGGVEPWQFALERLRLAGVDTDTWVPASGMWREAMATS